MNSRGKKSLTVGCLMLLLMRGWIPAASAEAAWSYTNRLDFDIFWPPRPPASAPSLEAKPLLKGRLVLRPEPLPVRGLAVRLRVVLSRPSEEAGREFWNSQLAFPEYDWMRYVRVWDAEERWLWPNLAYLLRLHGIERVERYGGVDPGKGVDNDFAAVLIRKYDSDARREDDDTRRAPLVAAEWHPIGLSDAVDKFTVVHSVESDEFSLHPGPTESRPRGRAAIWLIYADFMGATPPPSWPKTPEYAGGALAYFELQWDLTSEPGREVAVRQLAPRRGTGFDWEEWASRTRAAPVPSSTAKLSDAAGPAGK